MAYDPNLNEPMPDHLSPAVHPGEVLAEEFMRPYDLSAGEVARAIGAPRTRIERLVAGTTGVSVDTARRLSLLFDTSPEFWLNLQSAWDLATEAAAEAARADHEPPDPAIVEVRREDRLVEMRMQRFFPRKRPGARMRTLRLHRDEQGRWHVNHGDPIAPSASGPFPSEAAAARAARILAARDELLEEAGDGA